MSHNLYKINSNASNVFSYQGDDLGLIYIGHGETATYQGTINQSEVVEWYDSNAINTISGSSFTKRAGTNWIQTISLPAGTYRVDASVSMQINNQDAIILVARASGVYSNDNLIACCKPSQFTSTSFLQLNAFSQIFQFASTTTFDFIYGASTSETDPNDRVSESQYLMIRRLA